jgi:soluble lytic murein transglycosylase-like protein
LGRKRDNRKNTRWWKIENLINLIVALSVKHSIDPHIVVSVAKLESSLNQCAVGSKQEIGLFQIRPFNYSGNKKDLYNVEVNITTAIKVLKDAEKRCKHRSNNTWLVCYNAGVTGGARIKDPKNFDYMRKFYKIYNTERKVKYAFTKK